jgi:hypothetical protein
VVDGVETALKATDASQTFSLVSTAVACTFRNRSTIPAGMPQVKTLASVKSSPSLLGSGDGGDVFAHLFEGNMSSVGSLSSCALLHDRFA